MKYISKLCKIIICSIVCSMLFSGCQSIKRIFNPIPDNYTEGIKYDRDFPDDILALYDNALVFEEDNDSGEMIIFAGSEDDMEDICDFYADFFEDNKITLLEERDRRKEYIAVFEFGGYMMRIEVNEPKGEYEEELYESVITYGAEKLTDSQLTELYATPTPKPSPIPSPTPPVVSNMQLDIDTYTSWWSTGDDLSEGDFNFTIKNSTQGTMYYMNSSIPEMWSKDFKYLYIDNILTFNFDDGTKSQYEVSTNELNDLVLTSVEDPSLIHNCYRNSEYIIKSLSTNNFTAFGCWYRYDAEYNNIEVLTLLEDGGCIYYNTDSKEHEFIDYEYNNFLLTLYFEENPVTYKVDYLGNILELEDENGEPMTFLMRANETLMVGSYTLEQTNDENVTKMDLGLDYFGILTIDMVDGDNTYYDTDDSWFIDRGKGVLVMYDNEDSDEYELSYYYHVNFDELYLFSKDFSKYYYLSAQTELFFASLIHLFAGKSDQPIPFIYTMVFISFAFLKHLRQKPLYILNHAGVFRIHQPIY